MIGACGIAKLNVLKTNHLRARINSAKLPSRERQRTADDIAARTEQFHNAFSRTRCTLQLAHHLRDSANGAGNNNGIKQKAGQITGTHSAGNDVLAAKPQHHPNATHRQQDNHQRQPGALLNTFYADLKGAIYRIGEALNIVLLMGKGLHHLDMPQRLGQVAPHTGNLVLTVTG